tara:strand:+ start:437 stop:538 length:102 start_codon:yes stop_codon:yes gene_type:complete
MSEKLALSSLIDYKTLQRRAIDMQIDEISIGII